MAYSSLRFMARSLRSVDSLWQKLSCHRVSVANEPSAIERVKRASHLLSAILQHHSFNHVRHVFAAVDRIFDRFVDFFPLQHLKWIIASFEKFSDGRTIDEVAFVL